jgi:Ariadne domain
VISVMLLVASNITVQRCMQAACWWPYVSACGFRSRFGSGNASGSLRLDIINSTVNIDARLVKLYELLENDVLASLSGAAANCAPYKVWVDVVRCLSQMTNTLQRLQPRRTCCRCPWCQHHLWHDSEVHHTL